MKKLSYEYKNHVIIRLLLELVQKNVSSLIVVSAIWQFVRRQKSEQTASFYANSFLQNPSDSPLLPLWIIFTSITVVLRWYYGDIAV